MDNFAAILGHAQRKGVRLWADKGRLHYRAPAGALSPGDLENLRLHERQIIALLERSLVPGAFEPDVNLRPRRERFPLAFSQLAHWHLCKLGERRGVRHVALATRIGGRLNVEALRESLAEVVRRHDGLRTRIIMHDGSPAQVIDEFRECRLDVQDLSALPDDERERKVAELCEAHALETIDVLSDPLFAVRLLRLRAEEHVLLIAMEHLISDGLSRSIVLREILTGHSQLVRGVPIALPPVPLQFPDYAAWQRDTQIPALETRIAYWQERMAGCPGSRFPEDRDARSAEQRGLGIVRFRIDRELKAELLAWCRAKRTTLVMSACAAYFALVFRWCDVSDAVIRYQTDGRFSPKLANTVGYVAFPLYLRVPLCPDDTLIDLLNRVTEEYYRAHEHADFAYLEAQLPRPEFTRNTRFNWFLQNRENSDAVQGTSADELKCSRVYAAGRVYEHFIQDDDPTIIFSESNEEILGFVSFPLHRFSFDAMERFARNYMAILRTLLHRPDERIKDLTLEERRTV